MLRGNVILMDVRYLTAVEFSHSAQTREGEKTQSGAEQRFAVWKTTPVRSPESLHRDE